MRAASPLNGIVVIDKPAGWTSHDVVAKARGITGQRRIGHTGTLDPSATGVLVLCFGQATRLVEYMTAHRKRYEGEVVLGAATTTDDADGDLLETAAVPAIDETGLRQLEQRFTGTLHQRPPAFSAVKVGGTRAYAAARMGSALELPERLVQVFELELERMNDDRLRIRVHCGPGTYIRSLARDIGQELGCGAHLTGLRRLQSGAFSLAHAITLEDLAAASAGGTLPDLLLQPDEGIADLDAAVVNAERAERLRSGAVTGGRAALRPVSPARIYDASGDFLGVGSVAIDGQIHAAKVLNLGKVVVYR